MIKAFVPNLGSVAFDSMTLNVAKCTVYTDDDSIVTLINNGVEYTLGLPSIIPIILQ